MPTLLLNANCTATENAVRRLFEQAEYNVTIVRGMNDALQALSVSPDTYDFICSDVVLRDRDVFQLMNQCRANPAMAHIPFLILGYRGNDRDDDKTWRQNPEAYDILEGTPDIHVVKEDAGFRGKAILAAARALLEQKGKNIQSEI